jgi:hypothetical protein
MILYMFRAERPSSGVTKGITLCVIVFKLFWWYGDELVYINVGICYL